MKGDSIFVLFSLGLFVLCGCAGRQAPVEHPGAARSGTCGCGDESGGCSCKGDGAAGACTGDDRGCGGKCDDKDCGRHGHSERSQVGAGSDGVFESVSIPIYILGERENTPAGIIEVEESPYGLVFRPQLSGFAPGLHGFHLHENPSCAGAQKDGKWVAGLEAGGHWDPDNTGRHGAPWERDAHRGDLPGLFVAADGTASYPVLSPRLRSIGEIKGRSIMIHAGGDNHSDHPAALGGGGARMACGVIE